ncbi:hypothetical protein FRC09_007113 [Ceratobasidium sp. 395]|nr:hypothetical protein FRC09_007113 [Ceratobasidium sp. 395]
MPFTFHRTSSQSSPEPTLTTTPVSPASPSTPESACPVSEPSPLSVQLSTSTAMIAPALVSAPTLAPAPALAPASASAFTSVFGRPLQSASPAPQPRFTLPFALAPAATPSSEPVAATAAGPTSAPAPPYSAAPVASPPYTSLSGSAPPSAPAPTITNSAAPPPVFAGYRLLTHRGSLHQKDISVMSLSPTGEWIFMSTSDPDRKSFTITRAVDLFVCSVVNTGNVSVTAIDWLKDESYYLGFCDGKVYRGGNAIGQATPIHELPNTLATRLKLVTTVKDERGSPSAVTAIAFSRINGYLAVSTSSCVHVFQRRDYDPTNDWQASNGSSEYRSIAILHPFLSNPKPGINSLVFYGLSRVNLVVGADAGILVYSTYQGRPRIISALYNHPVSRCGVSSNSSILVAATTDGRLIHWALAATGPLLHMSTVTTLPIATRPCSTPPTFSITSTSQSVDTVIGAMPSGYFYSVKPSTGEKHVGRIDDRSFEVKAIAAYCERFYVAGISNSSESVEILAYSSDRWDVSASRDLFGRPRVYQPQFNLLSELILEPPQVTPSYPALPGRIISPAIGSSSGQRYSGMVKCAVLFSVIVAVAWLVLRTLNWSITPFSDIQVYQPVYSACTGLRSSNTFSASAMARFYLYSY